ncbi:hypothetical protein GCM10009540_08750 [Streptomyces turgidiscabies]
MCGAADVFRATSMSPQVVASFNSYFADLSMVIAGSFFQLSDFTAPSAGFAQGSGALLGEALGVTSALAFDLLSSFLKTPVAYDNTLPTTITPRTDAITELRTFALRRAAVRRCCCRKNFSRAS